MSAFAKIIWSDTFKGCQDEIDAWLELYEESEFEVVSMQYQVGDYVSVLIHYREVGGDD